MMKNKNIATSNSLFQLFKLIKKYALASSVHPASFVDWKYVNTVHLTDFDKIASPPPSTNACEV